MNLREVNKMRNILIIEEGRQASGEKLLDEIKKIIKCPIGGYDIHIKRDAENNKIREFNLVSLYSNEKGNIFFKTDDAAGTDKFNIEIFNTKGVEFLQESLNNGEVLIFNEIGYLESKAEKFTREVIKALNSEKVVIALLKKVNCDYINYIAARKDVSIFSVSEDNKIYAKEGIIKLLKEWKIPISHND